MSNRAWMPLHIDDYITDTDHLTATEHGAYLLLIMKYWRDGGLPSDEGMIRRYAKMTLEQWTESRDVIAAFFDDGWRHGRIDAELSKADEIIEKRRSAASSRHHKPKPDANAEQVQSKCNDTHVPPLTDNHFEKKREREFDEWFSSWPSQASDDVDASRAECLNLSDQDWSTAVSKTGEYLEAAKGGGRTMVVSSGNYLKKRLWTRLKAKPSAKPTAAPSGANYGNPEVYKPPPPETPEQKRRRIEMASQLKTIANAMRA
jgi:uncharacterized protein YdaU (DUF1376 family)